MNLSIAQEAKQILDDNLYMTISVADKDGNPWIANLYFAYDGDLNLYWYSSKETKHSQLISQNPSIAIAIFDSTAVGDDVNAVYFEATAEEVRGEEALEKGLTVFAQKMLETNFIPDKESADTFIKDKGDFTGDTVLRLYQAVPQKAYTLIDPDVVNEKYIDRRIEISLDDLKN